MPERKKRLSTYMRALEARRDDARREAARQEPKETGEATEATGDDVEAGPLSRFLLPTRPARRPWK